MNLNNSNKMADSTADCSSVAVDPAKKVFLTVHDSACKEKKKLTDEKILGEDMKNALLQMEALDKQLENIELDCKQSNMLADIVCGLDDAGVECESAISDGPLKNNFTVTGPGKQCGSIQLDCKQGITVKGEEHGFCDNGSCESASLDEKQINSFTAMDECRNESPPEVNKSLELEEVESESVYKQRRDNEDNFPILQFPLAIDIKDIVPTNSSAMSCMSSVNASSMHGSVQSSIERNKSLCAVAGGNNLLTLEEEERISEILLEEEEAVEKYGSMSFIEEEREAELDNLLLGLGYNVDIDDGLSVNINQKEDPEEDAKSNNESRRDPVLRELAKQREIERHEKNIDRALRALLREPLPPVIRVSNDGQDANVSMLSSVGGESTFSAPMTEGDMQDLIHRVKTELQESLMELADHQSVRDLARSIIGEECSKISGHSVQY